MAVASGGGETRILPIRQQISATDETDKTLLPSFLYFLPDSSRTVVGEYAREQLRFQPGRVVQSAKSWLAHKSVSASNEFLPFGSDEVSTFLSPIQVSAAYLSAVRENIERELGVEALHSATVVITVPASFDELACEHTREAAKLAGFSEEIRLLEEPQAAFYRYLDIGEFSKNIEKILVCDIGGGTCDLSLFRLKHVPGHAAPDIERIRVSEHLLLGGDNLDLAIASILKERGESQNISLSRSQWLSLQAESRTLKERVFNGDNNDQNLTVSLGGAGSNLFTSSVSLSVNSSEIREKILKDFFPAELETPLTSGSMDLGLPFPFDMRFTAHISGFIGSDKIDAILFVGGSLHPKIFRERIIEQIARAQGSQPLELKQSEFDLAVAYGASAFGRKIRKKEVRIKSGHARSLYVRAGNSLLCVLPFGFDEGETVQVETGGAKLLLKVNSPARFELYSSLHRETDKPGDIVSLDSSTFQLVSPMNTYLSLSGRESKVPEIPVKLESGVNDLGRFQLALTNPERELKWKLEFSPQQKGHAVISGTATHPKLKEALRFIDAVFGKGSSAPKGTGARSLFRDLEKVLGESRDEWSPILLRSLWPSLEKGITRRDRSKDHETTWLMLAGFLLRPGIGVELDSERIERLWRAFNLGLSFPAERANQVQWTLMWRRVSLGLDAEKQERLFDSLRPKKAGELAKLRTDPERLRLLAALERIEPKEKLSLVRGLLEAGYKEGFDELTSWCLVRLLNRTPLSGAVDRLISGVETEAILKEILELDIRERNFKGLERVLYYGIHLSGEPIFDVSEELRINIKRRLGSLGYTSTQLAATDLVGKLGSSEYVQIAGEALPPGLRLLI